MVINRLWKFCDINRISLFGFKDFYKELEFKERLRSVLGVYDVNLIGDISLVDREVILLSAEHALHHEFDLLGSGYTRLDPIDWHIDFKSGIRWGKLFYKEQARPKGADIKVPWELSRCQHLLWLGVAYLLTNEEKYAKEVIDEIIWWIDDNPLMYSVNWTCSMDVAFRAVNWMCALNMISGYKDFNEDFSIKVSKSLWQHMFFIRHNLEKGSPYSNNHYASDLAGLIFLGSFFYHERKGFRCLKFAVKEFFKEIRLQVLPSGVHYERSVSYHRLMTEIVSYPIYVLLRGGFDIPKDIMSRVNCMYGFVASYIKPNGFSPLIADNDDGRFAPFINRDFRCHNYLIDTESIENRFIAAGINYQFSPIINNDSIYPDAGFAILHEGDNYLFVNHGGYSKCPKETDTYIKTHTHNDLLSYELSLNGEDLLVDGGAYLYTSSEESRNEFRSTLKHNTVVVDNEEQNGLISTFSLKRNVVKSGLSLEKDGIEGSYTTLNGRMTHKRVFTFKNEKLVIRDYLGKKGNNHDAKFYFHFAEGVAPSIIDDVIHISHGFKIEFSIKPSSLVIIDDTLSPSYGVLVNTKTAIASYTFDERLIITTTIYG